MKSQLGMLCGVFILTLGSTQLEAMRAGGRTVGGLDWRRAQLAEAAEQRLRVQQQKLQEAARAQQQRSEIAETTQEQKVHQVQQHQVVHASARQERRQEADDILDRMSEPIRQAWQQHLQKERLEQIEAKMISDTDPFDIASAVRKRVVERSKAIREAAQDLGKEASAITPDELEAFRKKQVAARRASIQRGQRQRSVSVVQGKRTPRRDPEQAAKLEAVKILLGSRPDPSKADEIIAEKFAGMSGKEALAFARDQRAQLQARQSSYADLRRQLKDVAAELGFPTVSGLVAHQRSAGLVTATDPIDELMEALSSAQAQLQRQRQRPERVRVSLLPEAARARGRGVDPIQDVQGQLEQAIAQGKARIANIQEQVGSTENKMDALNASLEKAQGQRRRLRALKEQLTALPTEQRRVFESEETRLSSRIRNLGRQLGEQREAREALVRDMTSAQQEQSQRMASRWQLQSALGQEPESPLAAEIQAFAQRQQASGPTEQQRLFSQVQSRIGELQEEYRKKDRSVGNAQRAIEAKRAELTEAQERLGELKLLDRLAREQGVSGLLGKEDPAQELARQERVIADLSRDVRRLRGRVQSVAQEAGQLLQDAGNLRRYLQVIEGVQPSEREVLTRVVRPGITPRVAAQPVSPPVSVAPSLIQTGYEPTVIVPPSPTASVATQRFDAPRRPRDIHTISTQVEAERAPTRVGDIGFGGAIGQVGAGVGRVGPRTPTPPGALASEWGVGSRMGPGGIVEVDIPMSPELEVAPESRFAPGAIGTQPGTEQRPAEIQSRRGGTTWLDQLEQGIMAGFK